MFQTRRLHPVLLILAAVLSVAPPSPAAPADGALLEESGYEALEAGRLEQAERLFLRALEYDPRSAAATAGLGFLDMRGWEFRSAERRFRRALEFAPGDPVIEKALADSRFWAALKEGDAALSQGLKAKAHARYQEALAVKPGDPSVLERLVKSRPPADVGAIQETQIAVSAPDPTPAPTTTTTTTETQPKETHPAVIAEVAESRPAPEPTPAELIHEAESLLKAGDLAAAQPILVRQGEDQAQWASVRNLVRRGLTQPLSRIELQSLLAAAYLGLDDVPNGIRVIRLAEADLHARGRAVPSHMEVQAVRLMLRRNPFDHELSSRLTNASTRPGLPGPAVDDFHELWINWSIDWARKSMDRGRPDRALAMLQRAQRSYPREPRIAAAMDEARDGAQRRPRRPRWRKNPGVIVIHGLRDEPVALAKAPERPRTPKRLSGGITIAGA